MSMRSDYDRENLMKEEMLKQLKEVDIFQKKLEEAKKSFIE
jgi:hypothetical protein